jgi:F-type H+-transporting ATPase subunit gamma
MATAASARAIKNRIASVKNMEKLTKAMKMVSAAKLRRAQQAIMAARPYAKRMDDLLGLLASSVHKREIHPLLIERDVIKRLGIVVITSDRGLCGSFNSNIIKKSINHYQENQDKEIELITVGKKVHDYYKKRPQYKIIGKYINFFNELTYENSTEITDQIIELYKKEHLDRIDIIYNEFKSAITHEIVVKQLLPIVPHTPEEDEVIRDYTYEPNAESVMDAILPRHLNIQIWRILLESLAAEHGARMAAMESATQNASEMVDELTLWLNRARQASITNEIIDIVGGAEAIQQ